MKTYRLILLSVAVFFCAAFLGYLRADTTRPDFQRFRDFMGKSITVSGFVRGEPSEKPNGQSFTLDIPKARSEGGKVSINVTARAGSTIRYGDAVSVRGTLKTPENFMTDQGNEFDYISYLYKDDILYQMNNATVSTLSRGHGNWLVARLIPVKGAILASFHRVLPAREADLLAGLNLGVKENIDKQFRDDLVTTGTIHIIALSGYNVTVVANFLRDFFLYVLQLSARVADVSGAACIVLFVVMTGLQSSAIRAGIMALIGIFARGRGRTYDAFRALVFAGFIMILWNPKYLVYDVSFALSFLATLGIIFITPILERAFVRIPKKFLYSIPLREAMSVTLGANLGVLPYILYKMGTLSLIALPANVLVLPAVPIAMGTGALAGLIGSFSIGIAYPISYATYLLLRYITTTIQYVAKIPYAALVFHQFPLWICLALYVILIFWMYRAWNTSTTKNEAALK